MSSRKKISDRLAQDRIRLAKLEEGGSPARPIIVESASQIEPRVASYRCLKCDGDARVVSHDAKELDGEPRRIVVAQCRLCAGKRTFYFAIHGRTLN